MVFAGVATTITSAGRLISAPLPKLSSHCRRFRRAWECGGALFADVGTLFGVDSRVAALAVTPASFDMNLRASVGVGLIWASPFGPIRIDYAMPVLKERTDIVQNINFGISTKF